MCTSPGSFLILQVPQTPKLHPEGMFSPAALAAASTVSTSVQVAERQVGEDELGGVRLGRDEIVEFRRILFRFDSVGETFLMIALHVKAESDQHVAHALHEGSGPQQ